MHSIHKKKNIVKAPDAIGGSPIRVFLAGTIEQGNSRDWQKIAFDKIMYNENIAIISPRRDDWDAKWVQKISNNDFVTQVLWEQEAIKRATHVLFNFEPETISLISMGEFFQCIALNKNMVVCCPEEYRGYGNISVMCAANNVSLYHTLDQATDHLNTLLKVNVLTNH